MTLEVKHTFQSAKGDGPDTTLVQPSDWNALHSMTQEPGLVGNPTAGVAPSVVVPLGLGLEFSGGALVNKVRSLPIGLVLPLAGNYEPPGWLICDGRAVSRTVYSVLYSIVQDKFGPGDGLTTFNIPDMRGRIPAGKDNLGGTAANRLTPATFTGGATDVGKTAGTERHILTKAQLAKHSHTGSTAAEAGAHRHLNVIEGNQSNSSPTIDATESIVSANDANLTYRLNGSTANPDVGRSGEAGSHTHALTIIEEGTDEPHLNLQPTITMNYIIYTEVYP